METRTKAAAAAASLIPFSCCCCFEEFNFAERTPMVLPCGHTYVCGQCTKRLNRCMECREPLFLTGMVHQKPTVPSLYNNRGRYSPQPQDYARPVPSEKIMLPIPKNLVLMSMMEAAQRQGKVINRIAVAEQSTTSNDLNGDEDEEEYNLDRIISGLATIAGPCGTYAVKADDELWVVPRDPRRQSTNDTEDEEHGQEAMNADIPLPLHAGQTIQVSSFEDGVAKLARDAGFVVARVGQLVKVAGPRETTCRLEGLLETIASRGKDLESTLNENRQIESSIRQQIEECLKTEPDFPVIAEAVLTDLGQENSSPHSKHYFDGDLHTPTGTPNRDSHDTPNSVVTNTGLRMDERVVEGAMPIFPRSPASAFSIDNSDLTSLGLGIPAYRRSITDDDEGALAYGCGPSLLASGTAMFGADASHYTTSLLPSSADPDLHHSHSVIGHHARDDPFAHGIPTLTSSFDAVDFRTGLSGHRGLTNVKKTGANSTPRGGNRIMRMSAHRGIGRVNVRHNSPTSSPSTATREFH
ncbi:hypothetical protein MPSEU_000947200 [Mayamaea pseudoterrestris]|nr:hypothetical protein MPSEU_000947200 [Mayamaea pseudoterrestris]